MYIIKKIDVLSAAKTSAWLCGLSCLIVGVFYFLIYMGSGIFSYYRYSYFDVNMIWPFLIYLAAGIIGGFIFGALFALLYNALSKVIGGIKIDIDLEEEEKE